MLIDLAFDAYMGALPVSTVNLKSENWILAGHETFSNTSVLAISGAPALSLPLKNRNKTYGSDVPPLSHAGIKADMLDTVMTTGYLIRMSGAMIDFMSTRGLQSTRTFRLSAFLRPTMYWAFAASVPPSM